MYRLSENLLVAFVPVLVSSALVVAAALTSCTAPLWGFGIVAVAIAGVAASAFLLQGHRRVEAGVRHHLQWLAQRSLQDLAMLSEADLPTTVRHSSWADNLRTFHQHIQEMASKFSLLEEQQGLCELRSKRLSRDAERVSSVFQELVEPVVAIDAFDELILSNSSANRLFALTDSSEHRAVSQLIRCEKLVEILCETRRRKLPAQRTGEVELLDQQGAKRWYSITARRMITGQTDSSYHGDGAGAVAILRDITPQKVAQQRNAEFVASVSHEMKTPLASIKAYVELLADTDGEDAQSREEFLNVINSQTDRLQRLIDNLLNLARIEAGVVKVEKKQLSLNEVLEEAGNVIRPAAEAKQITFNIELSSLYLAVYADRDLLLQAAINLLSNAVKYTPKGNSVTLKSAHCGQEARFVVADTGVGLSEHDCQKVFEKFYRVQKDKQMAPGTGLGLPLAKHIVEDVHGGQLTVESVLGQGSSFQVTVPTAAQINA